MTYTHRNGSTDIPTEDGKYWFVGVRVHPRGIHHAEADIVECRGGEINPYVDYTWPNPILWLGLWWGPLVSPWAELAKGNGR